MERREENICILKVLKQMNEEKMEMNAEEMKTMEETNKLLGIGIKSLTGGRLIVPLFHP